MEKAIILEKLIKDTGLSIRAFAKKCGLSESTIYAILKRGVGGASVNIIITICKELGITVEQLDEMSQGETLDIPDNIYEDIKKIILKNGNSLSSEQRMELIKLLSEL